MKESDIMTKFREAAERIKAKVKQREQQYMDMIERGDTPAARSLRIRREYLRPGPRLRSDDAQIAKGEPEAKHTKAQVDDEDNSKVDSCATLINDSVAEKRAGKKRKAASSLRRQNKRLLVDYDTELSAAKLNNKNKVLGEADDGEAERAEDAEDIGEAD